MSDIQTMPRGFEPPRRGRRPLVDVTELLQAAEENAGAWVAKSYGEAEANSVIRQLRGLQHVDLASKKLDHDRRMVYINFNKTAGDA